MSKFNPKPWDALTIGQIKAVLNSLGPEHDGCPLTVFIPGVGKIPITAGAKLNVNLDYTLHVPVVDCGDGSAEIPIWEEVVN